MKLKRKAETGMQHVLRLNLLRRNQLLRRARRDQHNEFKDELREMRQNQLVAARWTRQAVKTERKNRREDWLCGPLAPKRDIGESRDVYGAAGQEIAQSITIPKRLQAKDSEIGIVVRDRVVIVRGLDRGKIGEVTDVNQTAGTCTVKGLRQADFPNPPWMAESGQTKKKLQSASLPIPLKDVRLVVPLVDEETGNIQDIVVRHMHFGPPYLERSPFSNLPSHTRYLALSPTEHIDLGWPAEQLTENAATDADTVRLDVEAQTHFPSPQLDRNLPIPSVIAELRDPYARDRASHELAFMKRKVLVDMRAAWERERIKRAGNAVGTPQAEIWAREMERRVEERERRVNQGPNEETLQLIREEMEGVRVSV